MARYPSIEPWQPGRLERAVNAFRDHAADKGRKSRDWQAAFRKWIENDDKWNPPNAGPNIAHIRSSGGQGPDRRTSLARACDEGIEYLDAQLAAIRGGT